MINQSILQWFREETEKLSKMSWKKRFEHLWEYYRYHALAALSALGILIMFILGQQYNQQEVLISGLFVNTDTSAQGYHYLTEDYHHFRNGTNKQRADIIETMVISYTDNSLSGDNGNLIMQIDAMIAAQTLDYMFVDETAYAFYSARGMLMDLSQVLSGEQLIRLDDKLVHSESVAGRDPFCDALDITDSGFAKSFGLTKQPSYLVVLANTPRPEAVEEFLNYLLDSAEQ